MGSTTHWDAFVSHAWEDKETFVQPLVHALGHLGASLWYDEVSLRVGESLSEAIDRGIAKSHNGILVVSPAFLQKRWPQAELHALLTRRIDDGFQLLPIWLNVKKRDIATVSPLLADLVALQTSGKTAQDVAIALLAYIRPDLYEAHGRSELERLATGSAFTGLQAELAGLRQKVANLLCPHCEAPLIQRFIAYDDSDPNQMDVDIFECGHVSGGHSPQACPDDPSFPRLTEYELKCYRAADEWFCSAIPKTARAREHYLGGAGGATEDEARNRVVETYNRRAPLRLRITSS